MTDAAGRNAHAAADTDATALPHRHVPHSSAIGHDVAAPTPADHTTGITTYTAAAHITCNDHDAPAHANTDADAIGDPLHQRTPNAGWEAPDATARREAGQGGSHDWSRIGKDYFRTSESTGDAGIHCRLLLAAAKKKKPDK